MPDRWKNDCCHSLNGRTNFLVFVFVGLISLTKQQVAGAYDTSCSAGEYLKDEKYCTTCPPGYSCSGGISKYPGECSKGFYSYYGQSACTICPAGYSCSDPSLPPAPCESYKFSVAGQSSCSPCPIGSVCSQGLISGKCVAGELCLSSSSTVK